MNNIDLHPKKCNLCNGKVIFISNAKIYGKEYGSGKCYLCTSCGAYVGTHKPRPDEALGILANAEMREMKVKCHDEFDTLWKWASTGKKRHMLRKKAYTMLAEKMNLPVDQCHFGYFDPNQLQLAYQKVLEIRFNTAHEDGWNELDFFLDLLEKGVTLEDIKKFVPDKYEYSKKFMEEHGLL